MATFRSRILAAQSAGDLTPADMARWFDVPYPTMVYWIRVGASDLSPRGPRGRTVIKRLRQLEWAIEKRIGFPIPEMLSARDRPMHVVRIRDAVDARVPADNFTV